MFQDVGAWESNQISITGRGEPEQVEALSVTDGTLPLLGAQPALGRLFTKDDDTLGSSLRVVLTHGYWQRRFGAANDIIGQPLNIDGRSGEIIGVLPASFKFLRTDPACCCRCSSNRADLSSFDFRLCTVKPGATLSQANADVTADDSDAAAAVPRVPVAAERAATCPGR